MSNCFNIPDFSNFGIIANSIGPVPEGFLIKELAEQNRLTNLFVEATEFKSSFNNNNYDRNETLWEDEDYNSSLWDEDDEDYDFNEYDEDNEW